jgi:hypothetical protein
MEGFTITKKKVQALAFYKVYEVCLKGIDSTPNLCPNVWKRRLDRMEYPILTGKNNWGVRYIIGTILLLDRRPGIAIPLWCRHIPQQGTVEHNLTRYPPWSTCGGLTDQSEFGNHHCNDVQKFKKSWASFHQNGPCGILTIFSTYVWWFLRTCAFFVAPFVSPNRSLFLQGKCWVSPSFFTKGWRQVAVFATEDVTALVFLMVNVASLGEGPWQGEVCRNSTWSSWLWVF